MSDQSLPYAIHSDEECERLELQARLGNIQDHLRHLSIPPHSRILDVGCGSGSMARLIAKLFPETSLPALSYVRPLMIGSENFCKNRRGRGRQYGNDPRKWNDALL